MMKVMAFYRAQSIQNKKETILVQKWLQTSSVCARINPEGIILSTSKSTIVLLLERPGLSM